MSTDKRYKYEGSKYSIEKIIKMYIDRTLPAYQSMYEMSGDMFVSDLHTIIRARENLERVLVQMVERKKKNSLQSISDVKKPHHHDMDGTPIFESTFKEVEQGDAVDEDYTTVEEEQLKPERY